MIAMWDDCFAAQSPDTGRALELEDGTAAFEAMHGILDDVWASCHDVLIPGGLICINIGDAVRSMGGRFRLFANAARITAALERTGFTMLPGIVWRKPANSPTKFMGSGVLPGGAYVTLEHESILIARKGDLRRASTQDDRSRRRRSAIFWEERNQWYSDLWLLRGTRQAMEGAELRDRSAAFPLELAYRLVAMHSWQEDTVLDPFAGTGTTAAAAMALGRSSICIDSDPSFKSIVQRWLAEESTIAALNTRNESRLQAHREFVEAGSQRAAHTNRPHDAPVVTGQETDLCLSAIGQVTMTGDEAVHCEYVDISREKV